MSNDLTFYERQMLQYWFRTKMSLRNISKMMKRTHSALSKEIRKNSDGDRKKYRADIAQRMTEKRRHKQRKGKMDKHPKLKEYVVSKLKDDWSPDAIAGEMKKAKKKQTISHESIYHYIYERDGKYEGLYKYLRQGKRKRRRRYGRKNNKLRIPERKSIHERPMYIDKRKRFGDWESDSVIFSKQKFALSVQSERKSKLVRIHMIKNKSAEETLNALIKTAKSLPKELFKTITFDNGTENVKHTKIKKEYSIKTYFCDSYKSWQKGGVENVNSMIRYYLPRKTDMSKLTDSDIYEIQEKLNNRPRKSLNYKTPNEVIKEVVPA